MSDRNKQRMFATFEVLVGSTALAVSAAGLHIALNPGTQDDEKQSSDDEQDKNAGREQGSGNSGSNGEKDVTVKIIPFFLRER